MASQSSGMGSPDIMDQIRQLVAEQGPSAQDRTDAQKRAWILAGLGMMGARKGFLPQDLTRAAQAGLLSYNQDLADIGRQKLQSVAAAQGAMNTVEMMRKIRDEDTARRIAIANANGGLPGSAPPQAPISASLPSLPSLQPDTSSPMASPAPMSASSLPQMSRAAPSSMQLRPAEKNPQYALGYGVTPDQIPASLRELPDTGQALPGSTASALPPGSLPQISGSAPSAPAPSSLPQVPNKRAMSDYYYGLATQYQNAGLVDQAQRMQELALKTLPQIKEQKTLMQNGKRVTVNVYTDGSTEVLPNLSPDQEKAHFVDTGSAVGAVDPFTGQPIAGGGLYNKTQTPDSLASNALGQAHLAETQRHNQVTEGDPAMIEATAQAIAAGKQSPLTGYAMRSPVGMAIMGRVEQLNPDYNAQDYGSQQKALKEFTSGKPAQQIRSFNVALAHLDTLDSAVTALKNNDIVALNKVSNYFQQQSGSPLPTNFNAVKNIVGNEIVKAIIGSGGGVEDRDKAAKVIDAANSPEQLRGVIAQYKELMKGQLGGLRQQYETATKRKDFNQFLSPEALKTIGADSGGVPSDINDILKKYNR